MADLPVARERTTFATSEVQVSDYRITMVKNINIAPTGSIFKKVQVYFSKNPANFVPLILMNGAESHKKKHTIVISVLSTCL